MIDVTQSLELVLRLVLAALLGGIIGYQREISEKPAGLRTHVLVSLGSALIMIVSVVPFQGIEFADITRIAASVVTGIGFLGAGAIIRQGSIVRGLTTAASIWVVSGIGLAVGAGLYIESLAVTLLILMTLIGLKYIEARAVYGHRLLQLTTIDDPRQLGKITSALGDLSITVKTIEIEPLETEGTDVIQLSLQIPAGVDQEDIISRVASLKGVSDVQWVSRGSLI